MRYKGQVISIDAYAAFTIIILLLAFILTNWNQTANELRQREIRSEITLSAISISDSLVKSAGDPSSWEGEPNLNMLGLVTEDHILNRNKLIAFVGLNETALKDFLGVQSYNFYFRATQKGTLVNLDGVKLSVGPYPTSSATIITNSQRVAILNNTYVNLNFIVWR